MAGFSFPRDHQIAIFEANDQGAQARSIRNCKMNPGHEKFMTMEEFDRTGSSLFRNKDELGLVRNYIRRTVRIITTYTSTARPDTYFKSEVPYPLRDIRGRYNFMRFGTGFLDHGPVSKREIALMEGMARQCPCRLCRKSQSQETKPTYSKHFQVITAAHVVFDSSEAENTIFELFYDSEDRKVVRCIYGVFAFQDQKERLTTDVCRVLCVTHDEDLANELLDITLGDEDVENPEDLKAWREPFIISHPHGMSKRISFGRIISVKTVMVQRDVSPIALKKGCRIRMSGDPDIVADVLHVLDLVPVDDQGVAVEDDGGGGGNGGGGGDGIGNADAGDGSGCGGGDAGGNSNREDNDVDGNRGDGSGVDGHGSSGGCCGGADCRGSNCSFGNGGGGDRGNCNGGSGDIDSDGCHGDGSGSTGGDTVDGSPDISDSRGRDEGVDVGCGRSGGGGSVDGNPDGSGRDQTSESVTDHDSFGHPKTFRTKFNVTMSSPHGLLIERDNTERGDNFYNYYHNAKEEWWALPPGTQLMATDSGTCFTLPPPPPPPSPRIPSPLPTLEVKKQQQQQQQQQKIKQRGIKVEIFVDVTAIKTQPISGCDVTARRVFRYNNDQYVYYNYTMATCSGSSGAIMLHRPWLWSDDDIYVITHFGCGGQYNRTGLLFGTDFYISEEDSAMINQEHAEREHHKPVENSALVSD